MLRMRLRRTGAKKKPKYRFVIMESQSKRDGAFVDWLGFYDPLTNPPTVRVNEDRVRHWLGLGVSMSDTVRGLLRRNGVEGVPAGPERVRGGGEKAKAVEAKPASPKAAVAVAEPAEKTEAAEAVAEPAEKPEAVAEPAEQPEAAVAEPAEEAEAAVAVAEQEEPAAATAAASDESKAEAEEAEPAGAKRTRSRKQE